MQQNVSPQMEVEAWKTMMNSLVTFITASTQLMQTLNNRMTDGTKPTITAQTQQTLKDLECLKECEIQFSGKSRKECAAGEAEECVDEEIQKLIKRTIPSNKSSIDEPPRIVVTPATPEQVLQCLAPCGVDGRELAPDTSMEITQTTSANCACPPDQKEKQVLAADLREKLNQAAEELKKLQYEMVKLESITIPKKQQAAKLYQHIMKPEEYTPMGRGFHPSSPMAGMELCPAEYYPQAELMKQTSLPSSAYSGAPGRMPPPQRQMPQFASSPYATPCPSAQRAIPPGYGRQPQRYPVPHGMMCFQQPPSAYQTPRNQTIRQRSSPPPIRPKPQKVEENYAPSGSAVSCSCKKSEEA